MIPLGSNSISGYYAIAENGDVYCFGDIPFYGTVSSLFGVNPRIVAGFSRAHGLVVVSEAGEIFTLASNQEKFLVSNAENVVDALLVDESIVVFTKEGRVVNRDGQIVAQCKSVTPFIACSLSSNGKVIYGLDESGKVVVAGDGIHYGDITTLGTNNIHAVDIVCSPWGSGYWIIDEIGGVFCFGDVDYFGSVPEDGRTCLAAKIIASHSGRGYWIVDSRGSVLPFGDAIYCGHPLPGEVSGKLIDLAPVSREVRDDSDLLFNRLVDSDIAQLQGFPHEEFSEPLAP